jgi:lysozyme
MLIRTIKDMLQDSLFEQIKEDLIRHEGYVGEIYMCSEGYPTFGIGHMVTEVDMEYTWPIGTSVEDERILQVFKDDCMVAVADAETVVDDLYSHPDDVIRVLVNMAFNIGRPRLSGFKKMLAAVNERKYLRASQEMIDSRWFHQVGRRSVELTEMMRKAKA